MLRVSIATVIVVIASLAAGLRLFEAAGQQPPDPFRIEAQTRRLAPLVNALPANANRVGYVSDMDVATPRGQLAFHAAVYALAPRLVVPLAKAGPGDPVVGNYSAPRDYAVPGLELERDLGVGVILYKRKP